MGQKRDMASNPDLCSSSGVTALTEPLRRLPSLIGSQLVGAERETQGAERETQGSAMLQARRGSTKRSHDPPDPLFSRTGPPAAATLDNRTVDPTVNLSVDTYDRSASANAEQPYGQVLSSCVPPPSPSLFPYSSSP